MNNTDYIARKIADVAGVTPQDVANSAQRGLGQSQGYTVQDEGTPFTPYDTAIQQGQVAIVAHVKAQDEAKAEREREGRLAAAIAEQLRPKVEVGKIQPEEQVDRGTPLTAPEPRETIQAGIKAVGAGGRKGVFSELPFEAEDIPKGWDIIQTEDGGYLASPRENTDEVLGNEREGARHKSLGYVAEKQAEDDRVVQVKDDKGVVVQDVSTNEADMESAVQQALDVAGQVKGVVDVVSPEDALKLREATAKEEKGVAQGFSPSMTRVMGYENSMDYPKGGFDKLRQVWKPHASLEGGTDTVAYGHKLTQQEVKSGKIKIGDKMFPINQGLTDKDARKLFEQDWNKHLDLAKRKWKGQDGHVQNIMAELLYQGLDVSNWKAGAAIREGRMFDAQRQLLNSKWGTLQTPERALEVVHRLYPKTPLSTLKSLQRAYTKERLARGQVAYNTRSGG